MSQRTKGIREKEQSMPRERGRVLTISDWENVGSLERGRARNDTGGKGKVRLCWELLTLVQISGLF